MNDSDIDEQHTPGPWKWESGWEELPDTPKYADLSLTGEKGVVIDMRIDHYEFLIDAEIEKGCILPADRCLIAAAPDMLEALQNIENDDNSMNKTAWELIQAAIAKATGKENPDAR